MLMLMLSRTASSRCRALIKQILRPMSATQVAQVLQKRLVAETVRTSSLPKRALARAIKMVRAQILCENLDAEVGIVIARSSLAVAIGLRSLLPSLYCRRTGIRSVSGE